MIRSGPLPAGTERLIVVTTSERPTLDGLCPGCGTSPERRIWLDWQPRCRIEPWCAASHPRTGVTGAPHLAPFLSRPDRRPGAASRSWRRPTFCRSQARAATPCRHTFTRPFGPIPCGIANAGKSFRRTMSDSFTDAITAIASPGSFRNAAGTTTTVDGARSMCHAITIQTPVPRRLKSARTAGRRFAPGDDGVVRRRQRPNPTHPDDGTCPTSRLSRQRSRPAIDVRRFADTWKSGRRRNGS